MKAKELKLENAKLLIANHDLEERVKALEKENTSLSLFGRGLNT